MPKIDSAGRGRRLWERFCAAAGEIVNCLALGLRDALRARLIALSTLAWVIVFAVCTVGFIVWREDVLTLSSGLAMVLAFGAFSGAARVLSYSGVAGAPTVSNMGNINPFDLVSGVSSLFAGLGVFAVMLILMPFILYGLAMLLSMRVFLKLFLMKQICADVLKRYPGIETGLPIQAWRRLLIHLRQWINLFLCVFLCLVIPSLGAAMLFLLLCYWHAYGLVYRALDGIASDQERAAVIKGQKIKLLVLGASLAVITFIPFIGLIGPVATGASVSHFVLRRLVVLRTAAVQPADAVEVTATCL